MSKAKTTGTSQVYAAPGIDPAATLRPEVIARIELLRIVWRPGLDVGIAMQTVADLERFVLDGRKPESR